MLCCFRHTKTLKPHIRIPTRVIRFTNWKFHNIPFKIVTNLFLTTCNITSHCYSHGIFSSNKSTCCRCFCYFIRTISIFMKIPKKLECCFELFIICCLHNHIFCIIHFRFSIECSYKFTHPTAKPHAICFLRSLTRS